MPALRPLPHKVSPEAETAKDILESPHDFPSVFAFSILLPGKHSLFRVIFIKIFFIYHFPQVAI